MADDGDVRYDVAVMYYIEGQTMESIAHKVGVSRSTISRLLKEARERGYVHIAVRSVDEHSSQLVQWISQTFQITATVVPVSLDASEHQRLDSVAAMAASLFTQMIHPGDVIGVAWGNTISKLAEHLRPRSVAGVTVVQLNGAVSVAGKGLPYAGALIQKVAQTFGAQMITFPVPAFFDHASTRDALWNETSVRSIREVQLRTNVAIFGIGSLSSAIPSMVYSGGYLQPEDMEIIRREHVVGDVCTVLLRGDGTWRDLALNDRASGPTPDMLRKIPQRIAVVAGAGRVPALLAALRAGVITHLVIDRDTAIRLQHYVLQH
ncbi:MAG: sugar-binding domain-containing protein [Actinomycetaceae bacterium]|nr:helix-turn-helix domain-containing protein [Arcanobacterium sp.]MDD7686311.1 sugar-binding domain-containing protein [Actinomycetaceae bacterium]MDY5274168.1 sugar-binding domain-containing protein [Arcanobacterium sp.]